MKSFHINESLLREAFLQDDKYYDDYETKVYLNKTTGEVHWIFESDEEAEKGGQSKANNKKLKQSVKRDPHLWIEIPRLTHEEHHIILQNFLNSKWTDDKSALSKARRAYVDSIGKWRNSVDVDSWESFCIYRKDKIGAIIDSFLSGIKNQ